jgi:hypothetical protein
MKTEQMQAMLTEISNYFKAKLLTGDYKFISCDEHTADIVIDGVYKFEVWITNTPPTTFEFYRGSTHALNLGESMKFNTNKERSGAWNIIKPFVVKYKNKILLKEKQKEIDQITRSLEELKNNES